MPAWHPWTIGGRHSASRRYRPPVTEELISVSIHNSCTTAAELPVNSLVDKANVHRPSSHCSIPAWTLVKCQQWLEWSPFNPTCVTPTCKVRQARSAIKLCAVPPARRTEEGMEPDNLSVFVLRVGAEG
jgi:hypothetical protein